MAKGYARLVCNGPEVRIKSRAIIYRKYAKLILILLTQLVNLNFDKSYLTKTSQKPLYKTRFMLDDVIITSCVSREGCVPAQAKTAEEPEEPVRHSVTGNGERDGAKAERSEEDTL